MKVLTDLEVPLATGSLRDQVKALVPGNYLMRDLGGSLLQGSGTSARDRILTYLLFFLGEVIDGDELMVVAGISEYARRIRELRVEEGWPILSGIAARDQRRDAEIQGALFEDLPPDMKPDQYMIQAGERDTEAARRWRLANSIRNGRGGVRGKLLEFLRANVGQRITSEELRYVAGNKSEWARRARELRTEDGWPVTTRNSGDPKLPVGIYVLERDEQAPEHDRHISELVRREVMKRDDWACRWVNCSWPRGYDVTADRRFLEAHHVEHHAAGGANTAENLVTLCNLHHDEVHRTNVLNVRPPL
jgi:hypothetical protein